MAALTLVDSSDPKSKRVAPSFSGNERNRMFLQRSGNFEDATLVSGADFRQDGRGFALLDFDRDGYMDIVTTSPTSPRLRVLRNTLGDQSTAEGNFVNLRLTGGNSEPSASSQWSNSNGCGAMIEVVIDGEKIAFQDSCGEGLSAQNSEWIHVGLGAAEKIESIKVAWPSGKVSLREDVEAGSWLRIEEKSKSEPKGD